MLLLQSHHKPREGPFELNDIFAIINAVPAIALLSYGFFHKGLVPGLCFGAVSLSPLCAHLCIQYFSASSIYFLSCLFLLLASSRNFSPLYKIVSKGKSNQYLDQGSHSAPIYYRGWAPCCGPVVNRGMIVQIKTNALR